LRGTAVREKSREIEAQEYAMPGGGPLTIRTATADDAPTTPALFRPVVFGDGGYADTFAMGLMVKGRPAASRA
jgi:hypothetical protein